MFVSANDSTAIDYKFQPYINQDLSKGASYSTTGQIIYAGEPNFNNNIALLEIMQPNDASPYNRMNPICASPSIKIKNLGGTPLKTLKISYGIQGGDISVYAWSGELSFLEETIIALPPLDWDKDAAAQRGKNIFTVNISDPNGKTDEDTINNYGKSEYIQPPLYYNEFEIRLLTNKGASEQYSYTLKDASGKVITEKSNFSDNTQYTDSLYLPDGCYEFRFLNHLGYGLSWWLTQSELGSGTLRLTSLGQQILQFSGDFGGEIYHQFRVGPKPGVIVSADILDYGSVNVGEKKNMTIFLTPRNSLGLSVSAPNISLKNRGYSIKSIEPNFTDNLQLKYGDTIKVTVEFAPTTEGNKTTYLNIPTNDQRNSSVQVKLNGWGGPITGVNEYNRDNSSLYFELNHFVLKDDISLIFGDYENPYSEAQIVLFNALGQQVSVIYQGVVAEKNALTLKTSSYPSGMYYLVLKVGNKRIVKTLMISR